MTDGQEWTVAWLAAGGIFLMIKQIVEWIYHLLKNKVMKANIFVILASIVLVCSIIALVFKINIGQSYLLPIWVIIAMIINNKKL